MKLENLYKGLGMSFKIFGLTLLFAIPLGICVAILRTSKNKIVSKIVELYVLIIRGTPLLLQIICIYFVPYYIFGKTYNRFLAVIIAFSINYAAYFGEIFRGGLEDIQRGQWEAGITLGINKVRLFFKVILPQVIKKVIPSISNEVITLIRDTSLAQVIGVCELFSFAQKQSNITFSLVPLFIAGLIYLIISVILTKMFKYTEKKMNYYEI